MGSFTELSLSFYLRRDVPAPVLATFAPLYVPLEFPPYSGPAPKLPTYQPPAGDEWWEPDWREGYGPDHVDPLAAEPWRHDWATWLSGSMSVSTVPTAALQWSELGQWHFSCRCSFKTWPEAIVEFLAWLGPFIQTSDNPNYPRPDLIGLMTPDSSFRPYLLWCQNGRLSLENLNGPDDEF